MATIVEVLLGGAGVIAVLISAVAVGMIVMIWRGFRGK